MNNIPWNSLCSYMIFIYILIMKNFKNVRKISANVTENMSRYRVNKGFYNFVAEKVLNNNWIK